MNVRNIGLVYRKELTEWLRDRRTLISTVVVPLLAFPLLMTGISALAIAVIGKAEKEKPTVVLLGGEDSPRILEDLRRLEKIELVPTTPNWKDRIANKEIRAAIELPAGFQASLEGAEPETVKIYYYEGDLKSSFGANHVEKYFKDYRDKIIKERLSAKHLPATLLKPFEVKQENVAPPEKVSGAAFGGLISYMVILLCMTGATYPAIDLTAGEKERGTMETILSSPIARLDLVLGKFFLVLSAALATATLSVISMGLSFGVLGKFRALGSSSQGRGLELHIGLKTALAVFAMALPLAVFFAGVLMTIALFAKTYKEAQSYLMPMTFAVVIPAVASLLPGVELTPKLALIPILNTSLVCKEIVAGTYHWNMIALIFVSSCVYAAAGLFLAVKMFQRESVLFRS
ncbi:MAG TPA: ABC transporter permease [Candidatus Acidoferrum sp.]|nr:ABC transporter permease [Candidatus Acidoferrum sp.]